jgi:hypothetical protein
LGVRQSRNVARDPARFHDTLGPVFLFLLIEFGSPETGLRSAESRANLNASDETRLPPGA